MTKVDFYILDSTKLSSRLQFACRLAEKAWMMNHQVFLFTREHAEALEQLLWSFRPDSFIPHDSSAEIQVGHQPPPSAHDVIINLDDDIPPQFSRFQRLSEIVIQDKNVLQSTRSHYRYYQERGYPLESHDLRKSANIDHGKRFQ
jgi:DNA polymerase-3 subunit chi